MILLVTLNARHAHASFGLRYLRANMGELRAETEILERVISDPRLEIVEAILARSPSIVGFGVYIWNVLETTAVVADLKALRPDITVVLGGPEVSYETDDLAIVHLADHVIQGEADLAFAELARALVAGERPPKTIAAPLPSLDRIALPYAEYTDGDLAHRVVYVEASRGCPYRCEFCLSSLDVPVRAFALDAFLREMDELMRRGARNFKFVDRTFNLSVKASSAILRSFLDRMEPGLHVHFELIPDRLPAELRELAARFPEGSIQFEIGIQTFNEAANRAVSRIQDDEKACENLRFLRDETRVNVHGDLLFGLPGETLESFGASFDRLLPLVRGEIQIGILKRLRGTGIGRHEGHVFSDVPPYEVLSTRTASFEDTARMKRFARAFEVFRNCGDHSGALKRVFGERPFRGFLEFSDWLHRRVGRTHQLALTTRCELLFEYLVQERADHPRAVAAAIVEDFYARHDRCERLPFLEEFVDKDALTRRQRENRRRAHAQRSSSS